MISYSNFQNFLQESLLVPCRIDAQGFVPFHSTNIQNFVPQLTTPYISNSSPFHFTNSSLGRCIFWHEEPINRKEFENVMYYPLLLPSVLTTELRTIPAEFDSMGITDPIGDVNIQILSNSEKSTLKRDLCKQFNFLDWYFFFHGFASLDWFRDFQYLQNSHLVIDKIFMCFNHLLEDKRNYRLHLLSKLVEMKLINKGYVSASKLNQEIVKKEILNTNSYLSENAKRTIDVNLTHSNLNLKVDDIDLQKYGSVTIHPYSYRSLWHVVTETVFYDKKLHLTEKIFKPIVTKRPFILCGAPYNLAYLKSYGFKTFDRWIDESYDNEEDPDIRIHLICKELKKLCSLPMSDIYSMHEEMKTILEYNHSHFYNDFKNIIVDELIGNFQKCLKQYNLGRFTERYKFPENIIELNKIKNLFT